jgi:TM2 domain-containing membrane protein YozV
MKRSTKAALLSGLVFPGVGHLYLKKYVRGVVLVLAALVAFSIITSTVMQRAQAVVDQINSGQIPLDTASIAELVAKTGTGADSVAGNIAVMVLGACWLIGIIDAYRLGVGRKQGSDAS